MPPNSAFEPIKIFGAEGLGLHQPMSGFHMITFTEILILPKSQTNHSQRETFSAPEKTRRGRAAGRLGKKALAAESSYALHPAAETLPGRHPAVPANSSEGPFHLEVGRSFGAGWCCGLKWRATKMWLLEGPVQDAGAGRASGRSPNRALHPSPGTSRALGQGGGGGGIFFRENLTPPPPPVLPAPQGPRGAAEWEELAAAGGGGAPGGGAPASSSGARGLPPRRPTLCCWVVRAGEPDASRGCERWTDRLSEPRSKSSGVVGTPAPSCGLSVQTQPISVPDYSVTRQGGGGGATRHLLQSSVFIKHQLQKFPGCAPLRGKVRFSRAPSPLSPFSPAPRSVLPTPAAWRGPAPQA